VGRAQPGTSRPAGIRPGRVKLEGPSPNRTVTVTESKVLERKLRRGMKS
jgi:hypothetical protein